MISISYPNLKNVALGSADPWEFPEENGQISSKSWMRMVQASKGQKKQFFGGLRFVGKTFYRATWVFHFIEKHRLIFILQEGFLMLS